MNYRSKCPKVKLVGIFFPLPEQIAAKCAVTFSGVVSVADSQGYHF